ncbi:aminotransferase class I/II-fold pyridoxal phosphate-dependent enzyme [Zavarzinella formosa]|uniref:aminotransferase class I/II-fold pyridoxal phosphate-dependent enzyme n=1 Tax=Zavarzinella formosa TaxID=360055 RepID=UPI0002DB4FC6|nr:8-amino-7-oxononanoate synthase [Zavarzinella formosa]
MFRMSLFSRWQSSLDQLRTQGRYRSFALPRGMDFTSNDYLGYGSSRRFPIPAEDLAAYPVSGIASRLLRGHHAIWEEVEQDLAVWHGSETTLMLNSGYTANEGLLSTIMEPGDWVASDELNHACIVDGLRLAKSRRFGYRHNDLNHLEDGLKAEAARNDPERMRFIITESLFSMDGDTAPLKAIAALAEKYEAHLIVDEAHSTGCFGETGSGCVDAAGVRGQVLASMHTGGKGLGVSGAYLACSNLLREYLINKCRHLIFTTALPPITGLAWKHMLDHVKTDVIGRRKLHENARHFRMELANHGVTAVGEHYIAPVIVGDDAKAVAAAKVLQQRGYDVRAIRPPSVPPGTSRLRISIHADHDTDTLSRLARDTSEALNHV